jgi:CDP-diacylglycerol--serine O-phosphatidyltransferase
MSDERPVDFEDAHELREHRRRRVRRHGRRAYIRSVYFLPTLATLGNAICGFAAIWIASFDADSTSPDKWTQFFIEHRFVAAAYFIFAAMVCDALDGRLARWARHTTDFGGQLDSLADVISFGAAPAFLALQYIAAVFPEIPYGISRPIWAIGAIYMSCAALRLARFNVSNEHGEQHHFSFLGMPSPGAGGVVAGFILMQHDISLGVRWLATGLNWIFPVVLLSAGLLMVSNIRYPHLVNRYLRGRKPLGKLIPILLLVGLFLWKHRVVIGLGSLLYMIYGFALFIYPRTRNATFGPTAAATDASPASEPPPAGEAAPARDLPTPPAST